MKKLTLILPALALVYAAIASPSFAGEKPSCEQANYDATRSVSLSDLYEAKDICDETVKKLGEEFVLDNSDGPNTGDGRLVSAIFELRAAYYSNSSVNKGKPTAACEKRYAKAIKSPSKGEVSIAAEICQKGVEKICGKFGNTGDDKWLAASCELKASHGAFFELYAN